MDTNKKLDYVTYLDQLSDEFLGFIGDEFPEKTADFTAKIDDTVKALLNIEKPRVMVYGIYNSGKSTLINTLMKKDVAAMADRPETAEISAFDHGDYTLIDSPGIDAPIQHEEVTEEFLNKCHIILFVVSSKGGFEARYNYEKLARLIEFGIPFIIVLNDRGTQMDPKWSKEVRERKRAEHNQELKEIQYKIIENLIVLTGNQEITEKYEVYILNAKKALTALHKDRIELYKASGVESLDQRIVQLIQSGSALEVLQQPVKNLKDCIDEAEQMIAQEMQGTENGNFALKLDVLRKKQENLKETMRVLVRGAVFSRLDELTSVYCSDDIEAFEGIAHDIFQDVEDRYVAILNDALTYIEKSFQDIGGITAMIDHESNLMFEPIQKDYTSLNRDKDSDGEDVILMDEHKKGLLERLPDWLKTQKRREKEKMERLQREAELINLRNQKRLSEEMRRRQEARQTAQSDLFQLQNILLQIINTGIAEKFGEITAWIQGVDCENQQLRDAGKRKLQELTGMRNRLSQLESNFN